MLSLARAYFCCVISFRECVEIFRSGDSRLSLHWWGLILRKVGLVLKKGCLMNTGVTIETELILKRGSNNFLSG